LTATLPSASWRPTEDYDDRDRWLDDQDGGDRWRSHRACDVSKADLFFPPVDENGDEPPYPSPEAKAICDRCPVRGRCLDEYMNEDYGIFGGLTAYQRGLMTKKIVRKRCLSCGGTDLVLNGSQRKELCLACGYSWDVL
jgi:WhiB family transcriptional regulator, redox-sensing transcriptional regulator